MVLVLGAESFIGRVFCAELLRRGQDFILPPAQDYCDFNSLFCLYSQDQAGLCH